MRLCGHREHQTMTISLLVPATATATATASPFRCHFPRLPSSTSSMHPSPRRTSLSSLMGSFKIHATSSDKVDTPTSVEDTKLGNEAFQSTTQDSTNNYTDGFGSSNVSNSGSSAPSLEKDLKKVVNKTAATFAPRASSARKNPAVLGSTLYSVFEIQAYVSMVLGGVLSFNLVFPSNEPDIWRLMGMWSIWMFTIPSLRARDCSNKEKEALNYLFILIPLLNVIIPFFWKSFAVVWSADTVAFFLMYAWKMEWLQKAE